LIPEDQITARRIFLRLVRPSDGFEVTSQRIRRMELYRSGEALDRVNRVLESLVRARLLRLSRGTVPEDDQVEMAHEALVRNWPRLVDWLAEERVALGTRKGFEDRAREWRRLGQRGGLLDDLETREAERWLSSPEAQALGYPDIVAALVAASRAAVDQDKRDREAQLQRERALLFRLRYWRQAANGALGAGLGTGVAFAILSPDAQGDPGAIAAILLYGFAIGLILGYGIGFGLWLGRGRPGLQLATTLVLGAASGIVVFVAGFVALSSDPSGTAVSNGAKLGALIGLALGAGISAAREPWQRIAFATLTGALAMLAGSLIIGLAQGVSAGTAGGIMGVLTGLGFAIGGVIGNEDVQAPESELT
jgi:hypothetical protein